MADRQMRRLRRVLVAAERFATYRRLYAEWGVSASSVQDPSDLKRLPPLEKDDVRRLADEVTSSLPRWRRVRVRKSSGTSGTPSVVYADPATVARSRASRMLFQQWFGIEPGDRELRLWGHSTLGRFQERLINRRTITADMVGPGAIEGVLETALGCRPVYIYGYASLVSLVAQWWDAHRSGIPADLRAVIVTAERSLPGERSQWRRIFGCPVVQEYGCSELEVMAHECPRGGIHVNAFDHVIEVDVASDDPANAGGDVLATDLNNLLMPLVRYRVGDRIVLDDGGCACGRHGLPLLRSIEGRSRERFITTPAGDRLHVAVLTRIVDELLAKGVALRRFRFIQDALDHLEVQVVVDAAEDLDALQRAFARELDSLSGGALRCDVVKRDRIEVPPGKKYSYFESRLDEAGS